MNEGLVRGEGFATNARNIKDDPCLNSTCTHLPFSPLAGHRPIPVKESLPDRDYSPTAVRRVWDVFFKTVGGMDAAVELTRTYLQRVLKKTSHTRGSRYAGS
jgi:hypothetical protein